MPGRHVLFHNSVFLFNLAGKTLCPYYERIKRSQNIGILLLRSHTAALSVGQNQSTILHDARHFWPFSGVTKITFPQANMIDIICHHEAKADHLDTINAHDQCCALYKTKNFWAGMFLNVKN